MRVMKKIGALSLAVAALGYAGTANAATIVGLFNTGVDTNGAKLASDGATDTHYQVTTAAQTTPFSPITYTNVAYLTDPNAVFIGPLAGGQGGSASYSLTFDLGSLLASTAQLSGAFAADNGASVFLNGTLLGSNLPQLGQVAAFQTLTNFSATASAFVTGTNVLRFDVIDQGQPSALLVTNLVGTAGAVPEPAAWAMMIGGVGLAGGALRRRRTTTVRFA